MLGLIYRDIVSPNRFNEDCLRINVGRVMTLLLFIVEDDIIDMNKNLDRRS